MCTPDCFTVWLYCYLLGSFLSESFTRTCIKLTHCFMYMKLSSRLALPFIYYFVSNQYFVMVSGSHHFPVHHLVVGAGVEVVVISVPHPPQQRWSMAKKLSLKSKCSTALIFKLELELKCL